MKKIKELLRLKFDSKLTHRQIARCTNMSPSTVSYYVNAATMAGLSWPLSKPLDDEELERYLAPYVHKVRLDGNKMMKPDCEAWHKELKRKGVTVQLLHLEYVARYGNKAYSYPHACRAYRAWVKCQNPSMRHTHKAGEKCFTDYCGPTIPIIDRLSGESREAQIFVATLGASNYTYAQATWSQSLIDWVASHVCAFQFFGGTPQLLVPDNLKSGVTKACRYDPDCNETFADLARHYGTAIMPARPYKPRDKSKVENAVLVVERWIIARLRNRQFFSLKELNEAIKTLLIELNERPFKKLSGCRASAFKDLDKPALKPLPIEPYEFATFHQRKVATDYHVEFAKHAYSVPYQLIGETVTCRVTQKTIEILHKGKRVASHPIGIVKGGHTTSGSHMPSAHRKHQGWTPETFLSWAKQIGLATLEVAQRVLTEHKHPEQSYRIHLGLMRLVKAYGEKRTENACQQALVIGAPRHASIKSILKNKLDQCVMAYAEDENTKGVTHNNVRGTDYYTQ